MSVNNKTKDTKPHLVRDGLILAAVLGFLIAFQTALTERQMINFIEPNAEITAKDVPDVSAYLVTDNDAQTPGTATGFNIESLYSSDIEARHMNLLSPAAGSNSK